MHSEAGQIVPKMKSQEIEKEQAAYNKTLLTMLKHFVLSILL